MPMPDMPAAALEKIQSQDLKRDAAQAGSQPHTVIVELDIPMGKIEAAIPKSRTYPGPPKLSIAPPPTSPDEIERRVSETATAIEKITGKAPETFFSTSGSFVVVANGEQLRSIATLSWVAAIWPNTRRGGR